MTEPLRRPRVGMISLGCPKNLVDSEVMLGELARRGYEVVNDLDRADTVVVNTCAFIEEAQQESIDTILEVVGRKGRGVEKVLVAGCMVNRFGKELAKEIPEIDGFVGLDQLQDIGEVVQLGGGPPLPAPAHLVFDHTAPRLLTTRGFAYLKVAEGCNNPCTFCAIPIWRGRFRSRTIDSLVEEARNLEEAGIAELNLIAQDTTRYGEDLGLGRHGLVRLVEALLRETSIPWIRFLYAYPTTLDEDLLRLMGTESRFCSYLDIPLQHSHGDILSAMRRGGDAKRYLRLLDRARELAPDVFLRSTFIVGFPGETEEHFQDLLRFVELARFDHLGAFAYSPEKETPGAELPNRVPKNVARRRLRQLLEAQKPIALERRQRLVGRRLEVLVEGVCEETEHLLQGRHYGMAPEIDGRLLINDGSAPAGTLVEVEITEAGHSCQRGNEARQSCRVGATTARMRPPSPGGCAGGRWERGPGGEVMIVVNDAFNASDLPRGGVGTIGNFDGVHRGQRSALELLAARARELGVPSVVVTFDPHPVAVLRPEHAPPLLTTLPQKEKLLEEAGISVLLVVRFTPDFSKIPARRFVREFLHEKLDLKEIYVGASFVFGHQREGDLSLLREMGDSFGFRAFGVDEVSSGSERISSSRIRRAVAEGDVVAAADMLGRPYMIAGVIARGDRMGKRLGWPTINLLPENKLLPLDGVYASRVLFPSFPATFDSVTNIGTRPTVYENYQRVVESHILDFKSDVYGERVELSFYKRLREERIFPTVMDLSAQIGRDVEASREFFARRRMEQETPAAEL